MKNNLFENNGAEFSPCKKYRYALWRIWDESKPIIMFIGLNPSTANETTDDATIRRVKRFAVDWGAGGVYMMNLFPLVSTNPKVLLDFYDTPFHDVELEKNNHWLCDISFKANQIIFAWGAFKEAHKRAKTVIKMFPDAKALLINQDGSPRHPLFVKGNTIPKYFKNL